MLSEKSRDFDMLFLGRSSRLAAVAIERTCSTLGCRRSVRNPWRTCLYGAPSSGVIGAGIDRLVVTLRLAGAKHIADIELDAEWAELQGASRIS